jgi:hypothetical protein
VVSNVTTQSRAGAGDVARITATILNQGAADAVASATSFVLDGATALGSASTAAVPAGASVDVSVDWPTAGVKGEHAIGVAADSGAAVAESEETNNLATLAITVKGNRVTNGSFEQANSAGSGPEAWQGSSTGAGSTSWSEGGSDGDRSASINGTTGSALLHGVPTWTSAPVTVTPGEVLTLSVDAQSVGLSSSPTVSLAYLGATGQVLETIGMLSVPRITDGFATLEQVLTVPAGVAAVRIVLAGFSATDVRTSGTVTFDDVRLE